MNRAEVEAALGALAGVRDRWKEANRRFESDYDAVMARIINEAAVQRMSVADLARMAGVTPTRMRSIMRHHGLNPNEPKYLLAQRAADTLAENAALLGIEPTEMDLTSPLAYLPMGEEMKRFLETEQE